MKQTFEWPDVIRDEVHNDPVTVHPNIMHGTPCFAGTRVPVEHFFQWLEGSEFLNYYLLNFPTVSRADILELLRRASRHAEATAVPVEIGE